MSNQQILPTMEKLLEDKAKKPKRNPWGAHRPRNSFPAENGEVCKNCVFAVKISYSKTFYKCAKNRPNWTHSPNTDIKLRDEACNFFEKEN